MKTRILFLPFLILVGCSSSPKLTQLDDHIPENDACYEDLYADIQYLLKNLPGNSPNTIIGYKPTHRRDGAISFRWSDGKEKTYSLYDYALIDIEQRIVPIDKEIPDLGYLENATTGNLADANCYIAADSAQIFYFMSTHLHEMKAEDRAIIRDLLKSVP